jgi:hypothetical protein
LFPEKHIIIAGHPCGWLFSYGFRREPIYVHKTF